MAADEWALPPLAPHPARRSDAAMIAAINLVPFFIFPTSSLF
jgi:hypothetical protein